MQPAMTLTILMGMQIGAVCNQPSGAAVLKNISLRQAVQP